MTAQFRQAGNSGRDIDALGGLPGKRGGGLDALERDLGRQVAGAGDLIGNAVWMAESASDALLMYCCEAWA
jgi:hypothetical protein